MWPDLLSNPGPPALESYALRTASRGPTLSLDRVLFVKTIHVSISNVVTTRYAISRLRN